MIPIWAKDKEGHWQVLPQNMLVTFSDGVVGYSYGAKNWQQYMEFEGNWLHLFSYDPVNRRFVLKQQPKTE